jgi:SAM-dependent methyltransferase
MYSPAELQKIYGQRFSGRSEYRDRVWKALASYLGRWCPRDASVLDLGAGYCEFINNVDAASKYAMDLNPETVQRAAAGVTVLRQDCVQRWELPDGHLDVVFSSNFFEHLADKQALMIVLSEAYRCLKPGGRLVAIGPNIKYLGGQYWDFFDHSVELTERSLAEALAAAGFFTEIQWGRFLPYTMSDGRRYPIWTLQLYLAVPVFWRIFGKQFLVVGRK